MKRNRKKILLIVLGVITAIILSVVLYFYIALSGNPIERWRERSEVVRIFEAAYGQEFKVERSSYDYKRGEFDFVLYPEEDPDITFRTSLDQTRYKDAYGETRSRSLIRGIVTEALGSDFDYLDYNMNVFEDHNPTDVFEPNLLKRLSMNSYTVDFSWDVDKVDGEEIDAVFEEIVTRIEDALDVELGVLKVRVSVFDGVDYHFNDTVIDK